jgi:hypothetical protein
LAIEGRGARAGFYGPPLMHACIQGMNCLRPLEHWNRGFESHSRHECLSTFILSIVLCVDSGLVTG